MMGGFQDKVVLITGASSGIGAALGREFARRGAFVVLCARRVERLQALAREVGEARAIAVACDVTRDGDLEAATSAAVERFGRLDVAVANAGFGVSGRVGSLTLADFRRQFETNVFGVLRTVYASVPELRKTHGTLVLMGSVSGHVSPPGMAPYCMSKFAVRALAESLAGELRREGVSVVLISPGFVESDIRRTDNQGRVREGAKDPVPSWLVMPTDRAARQIVQAVERRVPEAIITGHGKVIVALDRYARGLVRLVLRRSTRRPGGADAGAANSSPPSPPSPHEP